MNKRKFKKFTRSTKGENWGKSQFIYLLRKMSVAKKHAVYCLLTEHQNGNIDLSDTEKCQNFLFEKIREFESHKEEKE